MRISLVTPSLDIGGSERQVIVLARELTRRGHHVHVLTFYSAGRLQQELIDAKIEVTALGKRVGSDFGGTLWRLGRSLRWFQPHVIYSFREIANIAAALVPLPNRIPLVWGIRSSTRTSFLPNELGRRATLAKAAHRALSWRSAAVVANSKAGAEWVRTLGLKRIHYVPNGIDTDRFRPAPTMRGSVRHNWGISEQTILAGIIARLHPVKDHRTLFKAVALLGEQVPSFALACIGDGSLQYKKELEQYASDLGIKERILFVGSVSDMVAAYSALDIVCLSSISEGFPNSIGEAMACGIPVVATDTGDCAHIIGSTGKIVRPRAPSELAAAILELASLDSESRATLGNAACTRVREHFSVGDLGSRIEHIFTAVTQ